jgi:hypothetical protein
MPNRIIGMKDVLCKVLLDALASQKGFYRTTMSGEKNLHDTPAYESYARRAYYMDKPVRSLTLKGGIVAPKSVMSRDES